MLKFYCENCGYENLENAKFCLYCGQTLKVNRKFYVFNILYALLYISLIFYYLFWNLKLPWFIASEIFITVIGVIILKKVYISNFEKYQWLYTVGIMFIFSFCLVQMAISRYEIFFFFFINAGVFFIFYKVFGDRYYEHCIYISLFIGVTLTLKYLKFSFLHFPFILTLLALLLKVGFIYLQKTFRYHFVLASFALLGYYYLYIFKSYFSLVEFSISILLILLMKNRNLIIGYLIFILFLFIRMLTLTFSIYNVFWCILPVSFLVTLIGLKLRINGVYFIGTGLNFLLLFYCFNFDNLSQTLIGSLILSLILALIFLKFKTRFLFSLLYFSAFIFTYTFFTFMGIPHITNLCILLIVPFTLPLTRIQKVMSFQFWQFLIKFLISITGCIYIYLVLNLRFVNIFNSIFCLLLILGVCMRQQLSYGKACMLSFCILSIPFTSKLLLILNLEFPLYFSTITGLILIILIYFFHSEYQYSLMYYEITLFTTTVFFFFRLIYHDLTWELGFEILVLFSLARLIKNKMYESIIYLLGVIYLSKMYISIKLALWKVLIIIFFISGTGLLYQTFKKKEYKI